MSTAAQHQDETPAAGEGPGPGPGAVDPVKRFERAVTTALIAMLAVVVVLAVAGLGWLLIADLRSPPAVFLDADELLELFGAFLLVLIGIELLETLNAYMRERVIRAEVIVLAALIALARKLIVLDVKAVSGASLLGIAAILAALGIIHYLIRRTSAPDQRGCSQPGRNESGSTSTLAS